MKYITGNSTAIKNSTRLMAPALLLTLASMANANGVNTTVDISTLMSNPSFENGLQPKAGGDLAGCPTGWTCSGSPAPGGTAYQVTPAQYVLGADGVISGYAPYGLFAGQCPTLVQGSCQLYQHGLGTYQANTTYTLTLWVGTPLTVPICGTAPGCVAKVSPAYPVSRVTFYWLGNGNAQLQGSDIAVPARGQWTPVTLSFTPSGSQIGQSIGTLIFAATSQGYQIVNFDIVPGAINVPNTGQVITPVSPTGSQFSELNPGQTSYPYRDVGFGVTGVVSPDGKTLLVLTSGDYGIYNSGGTSDSAASTEFIFVFDVTNPVPVQKQVIQVANTYNGIVWDPGSMAFYVAGGRNDSVHIYKPTAGVWSEATAAGSPVALMHSSQAGGTSPEAAGIAISDDGTKIVVTNYENDSISVLTQTAGVWSKTSNYDLRPGIINPTTQSGVPGGGYPFWVTIAGNNTAYVSCMRDREIDVVDITTAASPSLTTRIKLTGQPLKSTVNAAQSTLYVAEDQSDEVAVINTATNTLTLEAVVAGPTGVIPAAFASLSGNNTNSVTLSPDQSTLYVTNGNTNNIAVVSVAQLGGANPVLGLIPTAQYPNSVAISKNGQYLYVVNGKSPAGQNGAVPSASVPYQTMPHCKGNTNGPVGPPNLTTPQCNASNGYTLQLTRAGLGFIPVPTSQLAALTSKVGINNNYASVESPTTKATMDFVASKIQHVVYIIKENRTYDQILGDLPFGNGSPGLTEFGAAVTPNLHNFAQNFVTLDNFYDTAEVSYDGWAWSTGALAPDIVIRQTPVNYSFRAGVAYESEGDNRGINLVSRTGTNASNPDVLPGLVDVAAPDGPGHAINLGYIWNAAFNGGLTVRDYGFFDDNIGSAVVWSPAIPVQVHPANPQLSGLPEISTTPQSQLSTDLYFRGYDLNNADTYQEEEFERDVTTNGLKSLSLVRMPHNHTGNYSTALAGVNTPELEVADNDYAVGKLVQFIANNPSYAGNTLIFAIEDDAQNGGDHVDAHRSTAFIVGPYVKQGGALVSTQYNTINYLRTMERVLGLSPLHLTDAIAQPMADVFDTSKSTWSYTATPSAMLYGTGLAPLLPAMAGLVVPKPTHDAKYWAKVTKGFDFSKEDRVDPVAYNRILWKGLKGDTVYPGDSNLAETRKRYKEALKKRNTPADGDSD